MKHRKLSPAFHPHECKRSFLNPLWTSMVWQPCDLILPVLGQTKCANARLAFLLYSYAVRILPHAVILVMQQKNAYNVYLCIHYYINFVATEKSYHCLILKLDLNFTAACCVAACTFSLVWYGMAENWHVCEQACRSARWNSSGFQKPSWDLSSHYGRRQLPTPVPSQRTGGAYQTRYFSDAIFLHFAALEKLHLVCA